MANKDQAIGACLDAIKDAMHTRLNDRAMVHGQVGNLGKLIDDLERLWSEGHTHGWSLGYADGNVEGYAEGHQHGYAEGYDQGLEAASFKLGYHTR